MLSGPDVTCVTDRAAHSLHKSEHDVYFSTMTTHYVFIDYENVHPESLRMLYGLPVRVMVFVGAKQLRVPIDLACSLQTLGDAAEYVRISGCGHNALDFHIAYALGQLSVSESAAAFHVISKDSGSEPLMTHLRSQGIAAHRWSEISEIPLLKNAKPATPEERLASIVVNLRQRGVAKPRKVSTLSNTIDALFPKSLPPCDVQALVEALRREGYISVEGESVHYHLALA